MGRPTVIKDQLSIYFDFLKKTNTILIIEKNDNWIFSYWLNKVFIQNIDELRHKELSDLLCNLDTVEKYINIILFWKENACIQIQNEFSKYTQILGS